MVKLRALASIAVILPSSTYLRVLMCSPSVSARRIAIPERRQYDSGRMDSCVLVMLAYR
jgi:hypothetical protein